MENSQTIIPYSSPRTATKSIHIGPHEMLQNRSNSIQYTLSSNFPSSPTSSSTSSNNIKQIQYRNKVHIPRTTFDFRTDSNINCSITQTNQQVPTSSVSSTKDGRLNDPPIAETLISACLKTKPRGIPDIARTTDSKRVVIKEPNQYRIRGTARLNGTTKCHVPSLAESTVSDGELEHVTIQTQPARLIYSPTGPHKALTHSEMQSGIPAPKSSTPYHAPLDVVEERRFSSQSINDTTRARLRTKRGDSQPLDAELFTRPNQQQTSVTPMVNTCPNSPVYWARAGTRILPTIPVSQTSASQHLAASESSHQSMSYNDQARVAPTMWNTHVAAQITHGQNVLLKFPVGNSIPFEQTVNTNYVGPFGGTPYTPVPMVLDQMGHLTGPQLLCLNPNSQHVPLKHAVSPASNPVCESPRYVPMPQLIMVTTPMGPPMTHHTLVPSSNHGPSTTFTGPMPTQTPFVPPIAYSPSSQPVPPTRGQSLYAGQQYINTPMLPYKSRQAETTDGSRCSKRIASRPSKTTAEPTGQQHGAPTYKPATSVGLAEFKHVQDVGCAVKDSVCSQRQPTVCWTSSGPLLSTISQTIPNSPNAPSYCSVDGKTMTAYCSSKPRTTHRTEQRQKARELYAALKHRLSSTLTAAATSNTTTITSRTTTLSITEFSGEKHTTESFTPLEVMKSVSVSNKKCVSSPTTPVHESAFYTRSSAMLNDRKRVADRAHPKAMRQPESRSLVQRDSECDNSRIKSNGNKSEVCLQTALTHSGKVTERRETSESVQRTSTSSQMINPPTSVHFHNPIPVHDPALGRFPPTNHAAETRSSFGPNELADHCVYSSEPEIMHSPCGYRSDGDMERDKMRHISEPTVAAALSSSMPPQNLLPEETTATSESSIQSLPRHLRLSDQTHKGEHRPDTLSLNSQNLTTYTRLMHDRIQEGMRAAQESLNLSYHSNVSSGSTADGQKVESQKCVEGSSSGQIQTSNSRSTNPGVTPTSGSFTINAVVKELEQMDTNTWPSAAITTTSFGLRKLSIDEPLGVINLIDRMQVSPMMTSGVGNLPIRLASRETSGPYPTLHSWEPVYKWSRKSEASKTGTDDKKPSASIENRFYHGIVAEIPQTEFSETMISEVGEFCRQKEHRKMSTSSPDHKSSEPPVKPSVNSVSDSEDWYSLRHDQTRLGDSTEVGSNMNPHNTLPLSQRNSDKCWDRSQAADHAFDVQKGLSLTTIPTKPTPDICSTQRHASVDETGYINNVSSFKPSHYRQQIGSKHAEPRGNGIIIAKGNTNGTLSAPPSTPIKLPYAPPASLIAATVDLQRMRIAEIEGSNLSLTSNLSRTSTTEETRDQEIHLLRRKLRAAEDQIVDLTSQLASSAQVVSAFEQSLNSMSQRLQMLTHTTAKKDTELHELRATIHTLRSQSGLGLSKLFRTNENNGADRIPGQIECTEVNDVESTTIVSKRSTEELQSQTSSDHPGRTCLPPEGTNQKSTHLGLRTSEAGTNKSGWFRSSIEKAFRRKSPSTSLSSGPGTALSACPPTDSSPMSPVHSGICRMTTTSNASQARENLQLGHRCSQSQPAEFNPQPANKINGCTGLSPSDSSTSSSSWSASGMGTGAVIGQLAGDKTPHDLPTSCLNGLMELQTPQSNRHPTLRIPSTTVEPLLQILESNNILESTTLTHANKDCPMEVTSTSPPAPPLLSSFGHVAQTVAVDKTLHSKEHVSQSDSHREHTLEVELARLRQQLNERELKLTDVQLEALASTHQVNQLRDQIARMYTELQHLRSDNERLQQLITNHDAPSPTSVTEKQDKTTSQTTVNQAPV
ncbi:hypothetical protein EG68_04380 [Paragonimus skrjabini miyazakii]|uniref:Neuron navigator 2 n=1 Tax=Paragonimus skrjabini miyazakii TaxID=59628 RepID=A0A8S9YAP0_9TREM|nr:hypothetical protein EG68_04380 [Paragonimus skrjabini miyazakii]